jgi:hypothetical protein
MSIHNPTNLSPKRVSQFVIKKDLVGLVSLLEQQVDGLPTMFGSVWLKAMEEGWWSGANALAKSIVGFKEHMPQWTTKAGDSAWHLVAANKGEWEARDFLTEWPIHLTKNQAGRLPFWAWKTPLWAEVWVRLIPPSEWARVREDRDRAGVHPLTWWVEHQRWALAFWFAQQGVLHANSEERTHWREAFEKHAPQEWAKSWKMLGV